MKLSDHFSVAELSFSETAVRLGIDNTPDDEAIRYLSILCEEVLEPLRAIVGPIHVTSGFRCLELNRALRSKDTSHHRFGRAADIQVKGMTPLEVCNTVIEQRLPFAELIHEHGRWCHVSIHADNEKPRPETMTIDRLGTRPGLHPIR